ncbi:transglutaminase superfamily protein [Winogradskyella wandonensis]|uniref:Transglutaminase superfamily protein n=1 Tax=Winogradskyella wandonensis TaxID=1442586 RepID=A0A4R1KQW2_9FLAO|nr:transglutaminase domain-containing protein [Winogradskyella wandonensis]TCK67446.1 transglutaminase superfamily protein [Winogradskyella wandonensis]
MARFLVLFLFYFASFCLSAQSEDFSSIDFTEADKLAKQNRGASLDDMPELVYNLTNSLETDAERFRAIYLWVCNNVKNDYGLYAKNKRKRKRFKDDSLKLEAWNEKFKKKIFSTLLRRRRTICTGYAYLVKTLSQLANIDCKIINGFGKPSSGNPEDLEEPNHSWNAVNLNGKWYLCDPTWASGIQDSESGRFKFSYNNGLFLVTPQLFAISHFPIEPKWFLMDKTPSFNDFVNAPILYNDAYKLLSNHIGPNRLYNEIEVNSSLEISYTLKPKINAEDVSLTIVDGSSSTTKLPDNVEQNGNSIDISYKFKRKGFYDVHLQINGFLVATYVVRVKKEKSLN